MRFHLERAADKHRRLGASPEEASRLALVEFGGIERFKEDSRDARGVSLIETVVGDLRHALRRLRVERTFTAIAVATLALGIGATTAIFSVARPILFDPLPYPDPDRLVMVQEYGDDGAPAAGTFGMYRGLAEGALSLEAIAAIRPWQPTMTGAGEPHRLEGQAVSADYFRVLGVFPAAGRGFRAEEDRPNATRVVVLSDALSRRLFGDEHGVTGRTVRLDGNPYEVVGVMAADFENVLAPDAELWTPLGYDLSQGRAWGHHLRVVARMENGTSVTQATQDIDRVARAMIAEQRPPTYSPDALTIRAESLHESLIRGVRPALLGIVGAVVLLLLIAGVNVTNLLLARGVRRDGEFALRAALGAGRQRLVRQLLTENALLAGLGGFAGIVVALVAVRSLRALSLHELPRAGAIAVDGSVLGFALALTAAVSLAVGILPAIQGGSSPAVASLVPTSARTIGGRRRVRGALVVAQISLALVLLVGSGLLFRSLQRLLSVDPGFDGSGLLTMQVQTSGLRYADAGATYRFFEEALSAVRQQPGVTSAALTSQLPLSDDYDLYGVQFDPPHADDPGELRGTFRYAVSPGYIETMRVPLLAGRTLEESDRAGAPLVALVSESVARRRLRNQGVIGRRLRIGSGPWYTVVGVVGDVKQQSLALNQSDAVYVTATQWRFADNAMSLVVRSDGDPAVLAQAIREAVWSVDKDQPIERLATMADLLAASAAQRRFAFVLFAAFALSALALAAAGVYGVVSGSVAERTREFGVRAALGATPAGIVGEVIEQGLTLAGVGIAIGVAGSLVATRAISALLFGVSRFDPATFAGVIVILTGLSLAACAAPAWRASRVDPCTALRVE